MESQPVWTQILTEGIPGELLLVLTLLIWAVFAMILFSNPGSRLNRWCFCSGMMFSVGALKEYLFYALGPALIRRGIWTAGWSETLYSLLSAVFYYLSMPAVLIFCLYFHHLDSSHPRAFRRLRVMVYLPSLLLSLIYPCTQTLHFQQDAAFCLTVGIYNWCYGIVGTGIILHALSTVSDTGHGMDADTKKRIFEPYYTTKSGGGNLGLGLYYCWNVMSAHGGSIRVTSRPGKGSSFSLLFPLKERKAKGGVCFLPQLQPQCGVEYMETAPTKSDGKQMNRSGNGRR